MTYPLTNPYPLIRITKGFRAGEWARIVGVAVVQPSLYPLTNNSVPKRKPRICYLVEFLDGAQDEWPCESKESGYEYEFLPSLKEESL